MKHVALVAAALSLVSLNAAAAQDFTAAQRAACKGDYDKFCKGTMPGGGRVLACLNKQHDQLSDACKQVVDAQKK
jgi:Cysteine rich repeat